eukprot:gnl/Dysnectes_brevis/5459_a7861_479.p1 GENE.gnl/Dysnectes_brevis/5459_a7861_479~~gnl/Dysnectes_brevis/5459_a7861_479.p1  ORF type:complete len:541 (+),score=145.72 gnl/Dysnectes_brevis/5459_a7861_479:154-1776(+)
MRAWSMEHHTISPLHSRSIMCSWSHLITPTSSPAESMRAARAESPHPSSDTGTLVPDVGRSASPGMTTFRGTSPQRVTVERAVISSQPPLEHRTSPTDAGVVSPTSVCFPTCTATLRTTCSEEEEEEDVSPSGTDVEGAEAEVAEAESGDVQMDTDEQKQAEDAEERPEEEQVVEEEEESSSSTGIPSNRELFGLPHYEHWGSMLYFCTLTLEQREVEELRQLFETRCIGMLPPIRQKARMREEIDGFLARASPVSGFKAPVWSRMNVKERGEKLVQAWNVCYFSASLRLPYRLPFSFLDLFERLHNFRRSYDAALPMTNPSKVLPAALSRAKLIRKHSSQMPSARMMADSHSSGRVRECLADSDNMFYAVTHTIFGLSCWCTASLPGNTLREEQRFIWRCIIAAAAGGSLNPDIAAEAVLVLSCFRFGSNDDEEEDGDGDDPDGDAHVIADGTQALIDWLRDYIAQVASTSPVLRSASRQIDLGLGGGLVSPRCFIPRHFGWKESSKYHATQLAVSALHLPALFGKSPFWDYLMANEHY